jgi:hypothetical protein
MMSLDDMLRELHAEFNGYYEMIFIEPDVAYLHKAIAIKDLHDRLVEQEKPLMLTIEVDSIPEFEGDIKQMREYLEVCNECEGC